VSITVWESSALYLKMLFSQDFWKLLVVCLKMLFRKSTRKRFICLVAVFLFTMGFNTCSYIRKFQESEIRRIDVLEEKAFKIFFLRTRTKGGYARFAAGHRKNLAQLGAVIVNRAFIYQNNLFIHFDSVASQDPVSGKQNRSGMQLLYSVFSIEEVARHFFAENKPGVYTVKIRNRYVDHNGAGLDAEIISARQLALKGDLIDAAELIRGEMSGRRFAILNDLIHRITSTLERTLPDGGTGPNPYLSRVALIVPINLLHVFTNMANDRTTDIVDFSTSVVSGKDSVLEIEKAYLQIPENQRSVLMYRDIDLYPRYVTLFIPDLLTSRWHWLLYKGIGINTDFMNTVDKLHFSGNYLFSYEKSLIIKDRVKKINADIFSNHINFYLTDLSMGIAFPFMISLFAFIHLKSEFAFLLMFKNRIRELLAVFWLLPLLLMLFVKGGMAGVFLIGPNLGDWGPPLAWFVVLPMVVSFVIVSIIFYPVNRWCFSQFTGDMLNLSALHKGR